LSPEREAPIWSLDIAPRRNPNTIRLNNNRKKVSIAINGTENFDVATIDPESLRLFGLEPRRVRFVDRSTPSEGYLNKQNQFDGAVSVPDGHVDLIVRFDRDEFNKQVSAAGASAGTVMKGVLTGLLNDGSKIQGVDFFEVGEAKRQRREKRDRRHRHHRD